MDVSLYEAHRRRLFGGRHYLASEAQSLSQIGSNSRSLISAWKGPSPVYRPAERSERDRLSIAIIAAAVIVGLA